MFVGGELIYNGTVEKGCGNQVFDYGIVIDCRDNEVPVIKESSQSSSKPPTSPVSRDKGLSKSPAAKPSTSPSNDAGGILLKPTLSPRSRAQNTKKSVQSSDNFVKDSNEDYRKPPLPLRMSSTEDKRPQSASSNSSNENMYGANRPVPKLHQLQSPDSDKPKIRSETRTMNYSDRSRGKEKNLRRPSISSDKSGSEAEDNGKSCYVIILV